MCIFVECNKQRITGRTSSIIISLMNTEGQLKKSPKIFISHSTDNAEIASALVELLEFLGMRDYIFCSSVSGDGVLAGESIYQRIKSEYQAHELFMIYLISPEYLCSYMSLNEMGAAWILKNDYLVFILPNLTVDSLDKTCIGKSNIAVRWDGNDNDIKARMNEFKDKIIDLFGVSSPNQSRWEVRRDEFVKKLQSYHADSIKDGNPSTISKEKNPNQSNNRNEPVKNVSISENFMCQKEESVETFVYNMYQSLFQFEKDQLEIEAIRLSNKEQINPWADIVKKTWNDGYRVINCAKTLLSRDLDKQEYFAEARAIRAFVYYNMAMLWGKIPLIKSTTLCEINIPLSETEVIYRYCLELLQKCPSVKGLDNRHVTSSFVNILYTELYLSLGQNDQASFYLNKVSSFNDCIFTLKVDDKHEPKSTIDIYTHKYVELLQREVEGIDNSIAWFDRGAVYGTWAALKRLGKAQSLTGVKYHELLLPIPISEININHCLVQNTGY